MSAVQLFGLSVETEFEAPGAHPSTLPPVVRIRAGQVPQSLNCPRAEGVRFQASRGQLLLRVDGVGRFHARGGEEILVDPEPGASEASLRPFLYGSAFGGLLHQRGLLPLHASAVETDSGCAVFMGVSSMGKSTLAYGLARRGYRVLADDVCVISRQDGRAFASPGLPWLRLCADMTSHFKIESSESSALAEDPKHIVPLDLPRSSRPPRKIFKLMISSDPVPSIESVSGAGKVEALMSRTYRRYFIDGLEARPSHFKACTELAGQTEIFVLKRPEDVSVVDEVIDLVERAIRL